MANQPMQSPLGTSPAAPDGQARVVKGGGRGSGVFRAAELSSFDAGASGTVGGAPSGRNTASSLGGMGKIFSAPAASSPSSSSPDWKGVPSPGAPRRDDVRGAMGSPLQGNPDSRSAGHAMRGFPLRNFGTSVRIGEDESKLAELRTALHKSEEMRRKAIEDAKEEMVEMAKAALAEGMEKGRAEGEAQALAKYQKQLAGLKGNVAAALTALSQEKAQAFLAFERMTLELFNACLIKVLGDMPEWNDDVVTSMLRQAVSTLNAHTAITVRVHPLDFQVVQERRSFWETLEIAALDIRFEADERVGRGGCLVEAGATSAGADPVAVAEQMVETLREIHQSRVDASRRANPVSENETGVDGEVKTGRFAGAASPDSAVDPAVESDIDSDIESTIESTVESAAESPRKPATSRPKQADPIEGPMGEGALEDPAEDEEGVSEENRSEPSGGQRKPSKPADGNG